MLSRHNLRYLGLICFCLILQVGNGNAVASEMIHKSPSDSRNYTGFTLENGLQILLISNPEEEQAAVSLAVEVGSQHDPDEHPGLAHFLEHMLFLGTEKYPDANAYRSFLLQHGGSFNAYTGTSITNYYFSLRADYLSQALDRFAQFFIAPLFASHLVERERKAVHSEYLSRIKEDSRRAFAAFREILNPSHPLARFSVGSETTLADPDGGKIRDRLIAFYQQNYTAERMTLVVSGQESLQQLRQSIEKSFSQIRTSGSTPNRVQKELFLDDTLPAKLTTASLEDVYRLRLSFPVPSALPHYRSKPLQYLGHMLGHEGNGSLLSLLKKRGWADSLSAGEERLNQEVSQFGIALSLTPRGYQHLDAIIALIFSKIRLIAQSGVRSEYHRELATMANINFSFQEKGNSIDYVRYLAEAMHRLPITEVLRGDYYHYEFNPDLIYEYLTYLVPENLLVRVQSREVSTNAIEKYYQTPYRFEKISESEMESWRVPVAVAELQLPAKNVFIPTMDMVHLGEFSGSIPEKIITPGGHTLFYHLDQDFQSPRANFFLSIRSPVANDTPEHAALTEIYTQLVTEASNEFAYQASLAGLNFSLYRHLRGITLKIKGYSHKHSLLLAKILEKLTLEKSSGLFENRRKRLIRRLENRSLDLPHHRVVDEVFYRQLARFWTPAAILEALQKISYQSLLDFIPDLFRQVEVVALAHGDYARDEAISMLDMVATSLLKNATSIQVAQNHILPLVPGDVIEQKIKNNHPDSAVASYFMADSDSYPNRASYALLAKLLHNHYYHQLRTEQQLGYVVYVSRMPLLRRPGLVLVVQSAKFSIDTILAANDTFLRNSLTMLHNLGNQQLESYKNALSEQILVAEKNLTRRSNRYWQEIDEENYRFDNRQAFASAVTDISQESLVRLFTKDFLQQPARLNILHHGSGEETTLIK